MGNIWKNFEPYEGWANETQSSSCTVAKKNANPARASLFRKVDDGLSAIPSQMLENMHD